MEFPSKKYSVIYADPPWSYRQHGTGPKSRGNAAQHYHTMTLERLVELVSEILEMSKSRKKKQNEK